MSRESFEFLGLTPSATPDEVKAAWRTIASRLHPDAGGDPEKFDEAHQHYQTALAASETCTICGGEGFVWITKGAGRIRSLCECQLL